VKEGDVLQVGFQYRAGGSIPALEAAIPVQVQHAEAGAQAPQVALYA
jgi:protein arginine N-methyltransferase 1